VSNVISHHHNSLSSSTSTSSSPTLNLNDEESITNFARSFLTFSHIQKVNNDNLFHFLSSKSSNNNRGGLLGNVLLISFNYDIPEYMMALSVELSDISFGIGVYSDKNLIANNHFALTAIPQLFFIRLDNNHHDDDSNNNNNNNNNSEDGKSNLDIDVDGEMVHFDVETYKHELDYQSLKTYLTTKIQP